MSPVFYTHLPPPLTFGYFSSETPIICLAQTLSMNNHISILFQLPDRMEHFLLSQSTHHSNFNQAAYNPVALLISVQIVDVEVQSRITGRNGRRSLRWCLYLKAILRYKSQYNGQYSYI